MKILAQDKLSLKLEVDIKKISVKEVIDKLLNIYQIADITIAEMPMEEIIANIYEQNLQKIK